VYAQVTHLFGGAPDLLEDFKQFLPESAAQHRAQQQAAKNAAEDAVMLSNVRGESGYGAAANQQTPGRADTSRLPPMGNFAPTPTANRDNKRKRDRQGPVAAPMPPSMPQELPTSNVRGGYNNQGSVNKVCERSSTITGRARSWHCFSLCGTCIAHKLYLFLPFPWLYLISIPTLPHHKHCHQDHHHYA
jgi:paired amphipathic helix protein Sin3a